MSHDRFTDCIVFIPLTPNASTGCSRKTTQSLMHYKFAAVSHVLYTKVFRTYLVTQKKDTSKYSLFDNWQLVNYLKHQNRRHF